MVADAPEKVVAASAAAAVDIAAVAAFDSNLLVAADTHAAECADDEFDAVADAAVLHMKSNCWVSEHLDLSVQLSAVDLQPLHCCIDVETLFDCLMARLHLQTAMLDEHAQQQSRKPCCRTMHKQTAHNRVLMSRYLLAAQGIEVP